MRKLIFSLLVLTACATTKAPTAVSNRGTTPAISDKDLFLRLAAFEESEDCDLGGHCRIDMIGLVCDGATCSSDATYDAGDGPTGQTIDGAAAEALREALEARHEPSPADIYCNEDWDKNLEDARGAEAIATFSCHDGRRPESD